MRLRPALPLPPATDDALEGATEDIVEGATEGAFAEMTDLAPMVEATEGLLGAVFVATIVNLGWRALPDQIAIL